MILLKANSELKNVFERMLKAMKVNVTWTGKFVVLNNFLILSGTVRSLIFNFDNRKVITNIIELPEREEDTQAIEDNEFLTNVLNMTLYAFGKWGVIKGIRVDQDYSQLNDLFHAILKDMKINPGFRDDNFRFYKDNLQITYEEVVQAAMEEGKRRAQQAKEEQEEEAENKLGLWHKICWKAQQCNFSKSDLTDYEKQALRLGNNFYPTAIHCTECGKKLFMVIYPEGKEYPVETEEGKVYLARCYTCDQCHSFYTPRPGKLLKEGDVYSLKFGGDQEAYEDYQELLGNSGERTANYHFNEYEWERGKSKEPESLERACAEMEDMEEEELLALEEKLEMGFYPANRVEPYQRRIRELLRRKKERRKEDNRGMSEHLSVEQSKSHEQEQRADGGINKREQYQGGSKFVSEKRGKESVSDKDSLNLGTNTSGRKTENNGIDPSDGLEKHGIKQEAASSQNHKIREKYQARMQVLDRMSLSQMRDLKRQIQSESSLDEAEIADYSSQIQRAAEQKEADVIRKKAIDCQNKPYGVFSRVIDEVKKSQAPESVKQEVRDQLEEWKRKRGQEEVRQLVEAAPANMNLNQYRTFRDRLKQYQEVDISPYETQLEEKRKQAEQAEISHMRIRLKKSDRKGLMNMLQQLKEGFSEEQASSLQKEIEDRLWKLDEAAIDKLCPNILGMTFDEAAEAYERIEGGAFLPELKTNTLEMIDKRLTKLKMDECGLLVEKLKEELKEKLKDTERLHFYEVRKVLRGDWDSEEANLAACALNTYATDRSRYEYPILIGDSSGRKNGKEGFLLTPDHLFYNSTFNSEKIPVRAIAGIQGSGGLLNRGLYVNRGTGGRTKIPGCVPAKELETFGKILDSFVDYLQEKPESRSIAYLVKEKHEIKCCYRCGFTYQGGTVCPKCGNQANQ